MKLNLVRFADDVIITGYTKTFLKEEVLPLVKQFLRERGLELSTQKTKITSIKDGFEFLGMSIRKYMDKLLIKPSKKSIQSLLEKVAQMVQANKQTTTGKLIQILNSVIRGWAQYFRHVVSKKAFSTLDHLIVRIIWQWATRRHPNKNRSWVKLKYFSSHKGRNWTFSGCMSESNGKTRAVHLYRMAETPIKRHIKVRGDANPYDPEWEQYFEKRLDVEMESTLKGRGKLLYLWKEQNGICPICRQKITKQTGWHNHHIVWRTKGGSDRAENRVLLHPNCHREVHSQGLSVGKPCLASQGI